MYSSDPDINPASQAEDVHVPPPEAHGRILGGVSSQFTTNASLLERGMELLVMLKEDAEKLAAGPP